MIRVALPAHLRTLARVNGEVKVHVASSPVTLGAVLDALEAEYPMLRGTIRDQVTGQRRPFLRFFACAEDLSHDGPEARLPEAVVTGAEPFLVVGAMAGGRDQGQRQQAQGDELPADAGDEKRPSQPRWPSCCAGRRPRIRTRMRATARTSGVMSCPPELARRESRLAKMGGESGVGSGRPRDRRKPTGKPPDEARPSDKARRNSPIPSRRSRKRATASSRATTRRSPWMPPRR